AEAVELLKDLPRVNSSLDDLRHYIKTELNQRLLNISNDIMSVLNEGDTRLSTVQSKLNTIDQVINSGESILTAGKDRIETIQSALPVIEQSYMDAWKLHKMLTRNLNKVLRTPRHLSKMICQV